MAEKEARPLCELNEEKRDRASTIIKRAMEDNGETQESLSNLLHISRQTFGTRLKELNFTESELFELCIILGLEEDYLTGKTKSNHFQKYESPSFIARLYNELNPHQKEAITEVLCSMVGSRVYLDLKQQEAKTRVDMDELRISRHRKK
ncbi:MAG: hypothetical protein IKF78_10000 [Atopobiaceae bacterium]|nr:hypothetical protein [Atopobiaceae bacterium]